MEAKTETFIKTSVDDNGMWLLTVPAGRAGDETVVVVVRLARGTCVDHLQPDAVR